MKVKKVQRILFISILLIISCIGISITRCIRYDHFHINEKASLFEKMIGNNTYTLYYHFYPYSKEEIMNDVVKTENYSFKCQTNNTEEYKIDLKEYIYDGISVYACFTVENTNGTVEGLDLFGCGPGNIIVSGKAPIYGLTNASGKGSVNLSPGLDNEIYRNKRYLFYSADNMNIENLGYPVNREDLQDKIYLIENNLADNHGFVSQRAILLTFPLKKTITCYETWDSLGKIIATPLQIKTSGKMKCGLSDLVIHYKDGSSVVEIEDGDIDYNLLRESTEKNSDERSVCNYKFTNILDFAEIDRIEGKLKNGKEWKIKIDSEREV